MTEIAQRILDDYSLTTAEKLRKMANEVDSLDATLKAAGIFLNQKAAFIEAARKVMTDEQWQQACAIVEKAEE